MHEMREPTETWTTRGRRPRWSAIGTAATLAFALTFALTLGGCSPRGFDWPEVAADGWTVYVNERVGYHLKVPDICDVEEHDDGRTVLFRFRGAPIIAVNFVDEVEGDQRGLWTGHEPSGEVELAGRHGHRYRYDHYDGPFGMQTVSYVVPHRDRFLGVELRTGEPEPTTIQQTILDSLSFAS